MGGAARWLTLAALLLAACGGPSQAPVSIVVGRVATATGPPTVTTAPNAEQILTPTPSVSAPPATPTLSGLRTKTPLPGSPSPLPSATRRRGGAAATPTPTPGAHAAQGGSLDTRAHGVTGTFRMENAERVYRPSEQMWFRWTVTNVTQADLNYGYIGVVQSSGGFHTSWSGSALRPQSTANWRDWVSFSAPGEYTLVLAICLSSAAECQGGGKWIDLTAPLAVTVQ